MKVSFKFRPHSVIDVITNSSTEIYSWYDSSVSVCKEMINEFLKAFELAGVSDDYFKITAEYDSYVYTEYFGELSEEELENIPEEERLPEDLMNKDFENWREDLAEKGIYPKWFKDAEEREDSYNYMTPENEFIITAKDEKYNGVADKIYEFLKSPNQEATRNG